MTATPLRKPTFTASLSARVLILTVVLILLSEALIYVPSISRFRRDYLHEHLAAGHLASLALEATPDHMVDEALRDRLLFHAEALGVMIRRDGQHFVALAGDMPPAVDDTVDMDRTDWVYWIDGALRTLLRDEPRILRAVGRSPRAAGVGVEVILTERPLREEMLAYSKRILLLSLIISGLTGATVYLGLQWMMIRPMRRIIGSMVAFRDDPEGESGRMPDSRRGDEIGIAQRALSAMQDEVRGALRQRARLAALGAAVAKINHDLRNSLATAVLVSDRLASSADPEVREVTPRLIQAIDRAVDLCGQTLDYAAERDIPLRRERFYLADLLEEVAAGVVIAGEGRVTADCDTDPTLELVADEIQLHRVLANLGRNAVQAGATRVRFAATSGEGMITLLVEDNGPGLPQRVRDNLFKPFVGSSRRGGNGLGLTIVRDVMRAHGGDVELDRSDASGTRFRLLLPMVGEDDSGDTEG